MKNLKKKFLIFNLIIIFLFVIKFEVFSSEFEGEINYGKPILKVVFLDVWQGDSALIFMPSGKIALIDAGLGASEYMTFDAGAQVIYPYLKNLNISKIDYVVMTHPHSDHIGGFPFIFNKLKVVKSYDCGQPYTSQLFMQCLELISAKNIKYVIPYAPQVLKWDPLLTIKVLHPPKGWQYSDNPNNNSIVLKIIYNKISFLFTGDAEDDAEYSMIDSKADLNSTILKVPHHGSDTSSCDAFLDAVNPLVAVISVGKNNKFGHPAPSTLARYLQRGIKLYRTDLNGTIEIVTDGEKFKIKTQKSSAQ
jgi:beta-lactamase superfamily II metal-dependent hydrolase